ncbi:MAG: UDP-N-acetylglucosamine 1-carboxyvinyltransferase [Armatimonadota bacterium]|nr:UDP-N-acetylglucosamine 1-carboxyvinyltransferase [Armatimonadota bacterium]
MDKLVVTGGTRLEGTVSMSGSKNGCLAIMAAALLGKGETVLYNVPSIRDVHTMVEVLRSLGVRCDYEDNGLLRIDATEIECTEAPYELVRRMRASFCVLGPVLARKGYAKVAMPGGCDIGARPVDFHIKGIQTLGAHLVMDHGFVEAECERLRGGQIYLNFPSAGATQHLMTAAALADGVTTIYNAAMEPEVVEVAKFLNKMGARVEGAGTSTIRVEGVRELRGTEFELLPDRMEAGTFAVAAVITQGDVRIENIRPTDVKPFVLKLIEAGAVVDVYDNYMRVRCNSRPLATDIVTMPHPGFPTDLQQPFGAMLSIAEGTSVITENVYERRFKYVSELIRMGADIKVEGRTAIINGVPKLTGAQVAATDLRAGAALVCAALAAEGESEVLGVEHIERGYENLVEKLQALGANIARVSEEQSLTDCELAAPVSS